MTAVEALGTLPKARTGIQGLDEVTGGGLPQGRPTLVCGGAGCGKTLLGVEFLVRGAVQFGEPGVLLSFEESARELTANVASLGFDLKELQARKLLRIDQVLLDRSQVEESGEYDLEGLFIRLGHAVDSIGARRVVLDTPEALFAGVPDAGVLRAELKRLFLWLKERGLTTVITGERGEGQLTRHGIEEYVSDCVIFLDHRVADERSVRRLRVVKYRGSHHGTNEYPFLIDEHGLSVLPITSVGLAHTVTSERVSTGSAQLDAMFEGKGFYRGSTVLVSGTAGSGKSALAAQFAAGAAKRGERCLYLAHEEAPDQILRNMASVGIDLRGLDPALFRLHASRPTLYGLEMHLAVSHRLVNELRPTVVVMDPVTSLTPMGERGDVRLMLARLIDFLKGRGITTLFTSLVDSTESIEQTDAGISSLIDTWILLRLERTEGQRRRTLEVLKSRGMGHGEELCTYRLTSQGLRFERQAGARDRAS